MEAKKTKTQKNATRVRNRRKKTHKYMNKVSNLIKEVVDIDQHSLMILVEKITRLDPRSNKVLNDELQIVDRKTEKTVKIGTKGIASKYPKVLEKARGLKTQWTNLQGYSDAGLITILLTKTYGLMYKERFFKGCSYPTKLYEKSEVDRIEKHLQTEKTVSTNSNVIRLRKAD